MKKFNLNEQMNNFLRDFDKFTEYLSEREVTIGKKTGFISPKFLFEMNSLISIKQEGITTKSAELSYPLLHLFCNLAKSSRLFIEDAGKAGKIILKPTERIDNFKDLNITEKYISILEVLWMDCDFEKLQYQTYDYLDAHRAAEVLSVISQQKPDEIFYLDKFMRYNSSSIILYFYYFGILDYKEYEKAESKEKGRFFEPDEIVINPLGLKIIKILNKKRNLELWNIPYRRECGEWKFDFEEEFKLPFVNLFEKDILSNTLIRNLNKFTDGTYTFKISLDRSTWAKIKLSSQHTLEDLHNSIQEVFDFDNDHMYSFFMDGKAWSNNKFTCPYEEMGPYVDEVKIGELDLYKKQDFLYLFDYGDEWRFNVKVFDIDEEDKITLLKPQIIESKGKVEQYPDFDDEW
ncbi:IS1096 element passenger TnpR family protein [Clostridium pasteurianum]|uniref:Plasmid pRiA4b ORF-3-like protein n=1 Tax=Clostridium pasteurianum BC1 TaxID=86416 RepID=R4KA98_CLOPA|nr:hypothetical protein [Clostridium pasteurianum]AGK98621.1 Plasmid pRiA4b ORF-3-like protein [Clostridium pasteurianum BC1]